MNIFGLIPRILACKLSRKSGIISYPFNLTLSVTGKCNSKCKTCNIWKRNVKDELDLGGWRRVLKSVGKSPVWITISGGEPFMREDLVQIVKIISYYNNPSIITIATNGILSDKILHDVEKILSFYDGRLIVNLSIDGIKEKHDYIRGVRCFDKVLETFRRLKKLGRVNVGVHTVISRYNAREVKKIYQFFKKMTPDSYICEIAEKRKELGNTGMRIEPSNDEYFRIIDFLLKKKNKAGGVSRITQFLRNRYYNLTKKVLMEKRAVIPCYAGIASAHINFNGELWACCMRCESLGNLNEKSFRSVWKSENARKIRAEIKKRGCYCTLANASYSNIICDII